ncbi:sulfite exporter TauE/SafE family protein [Candidatus Hydrogenedentota bacterium]
MMSHTKRDLRIVAIILPVWVSVFLLFFQNHLEILVRLWFVLPLSFVAAAFANATAVGGGFIFIPLWMFVFKLDPMSALKLSLATEAVGMTCGACEWGPKRRVPELTWTVVLMSSIGVLVGTFLLKPTALYIKGVFGLISILMGVATLKMLNFHGKNEGPSRRWAFYPASVVGGLVSSWISIGSGGIISVLLMLVYGVHAERSIGTGVLVLSANAILATACHVLTGSIPYEVRELLLFTVPAVVLGSRFGVRMGAAVGQRKLKLTFASVAIADGILMFSFLAWHIIGQGH